jgi:hypothetical protein
MRQRLRYGPMNLPTSSAAGGPFEQEPIAGADPEIAPLQDGRGGVAVTEDEIVHLKHGGGAVGAADVGHRPEGERGCTDHLGAGCCVEERRDLLPGDRGAGQMRLQLAVAAIGIEIRSRAALVRLGTISITLPCAMSETTHTKSRCPLCCATSSMHSTRPSSPSIRPLCTGARAYRCLP